jgi:uncharacterized protein (DUF433 family)
MKQKNGKNLLARIEVNPAVMVGKPVIRGTRITVELILRQLAEGIPARDILKNYPHLKAVDIQAAIAYAVTMVAGERVYSFTGARHGKIEVPA